MTRNKTISVSIFRCCSFTFQNFSKNLFLFSLIFFNPFWLIFWKWYDQARCIFVQLMDHKYSESKEKLSNGKKWNWAWLISVRKHTVIVLSFIKNGTISKPPSSRTLRIFIFHGHYFALLHRLFLRFMDKNYKGIR